MRLPSWLRPPSSTSMDTPCDHLWTNWSEPESMTVTTILIFSQSEQEVEKWFQKRCCYKCNLYQRHIC